ncbi:MAG: T9SS type A sorting domain-containing protein, partial [Bacteroidia bacterium]|nr:T9SS type A sorting domain-containing protein [Bacteroidia bacterium]
SQLVVAHWNSGTSKWENLGGTAGGGSIASIFSLSSFSPISFGSTAAYPINPLPIELLDFTANYSSSKSVKLDWITATETNNDFFTVERSADALNFEPIATVKGAGNSSLQLSYSIVDEKPLSGISYYRLKQTDFDGKYSYSKIVSVSANPSELSFVVFPNPVPSGETPRIKFSGNETKNILVLVYDDYGREVYSKISIIEKGNGQVLAIDPSKTLSPGVYFISASSDNSLYKQKLIVR